MEASRSSQKVEVDVVGVSESWPSMKRVRSMSLPSVVAESVLLDKRDDTATASEGETKGKEDRQDVPLEESKSGDSVVNISSAGSTTVREEEAKHDKLIEDDFAKDVLVSKLSSNSSIQHVRRYLRGVHEPELEDFFFSNCVPLRFTLATVYFKIRSFLSIVLTFNMILNVALAVGGTVLCIQFNLVTDLPLSLISTAVVFPISFGIQNNFGRREISLREVAVLRALALSMFLGARDWCDQSASQFEEVGRLRDALGVTLACMRQTMLHNTPPGGSAQVYKSIDNLALRLSALNANDHAMLNNPSVFSRLSQYLRQFIEAWERLRVVHDYRTPSSLRSYALVWLFLVSMVLAPLFAKFSRDFGYMSGIYCAILCSVILSGLHQIFQNEEDPFDGSGVDDLSLDPLSMMPNFMYDKPVVLRQRLRFLDREKTRVKKKPISKESVLDGPIKRHFVDEQKQPQATVRFSEPALVPSANARHLHRTDGRARSSPFLYFEDD